MTERIDAKGPEPVRGPDVLSQPEAERRAEREGRDARGRPLHDDETAPGERGDGPYGDSEPRVRAEQPGR